MYLFPMTPEAPLLAGDRLLTHLQQIGFMGSPQTGFSRTFAQGEQFQKLMGMEKEKFDYDFAITVATEDDVEIIFSAETQDVRPTCRCGGQLENFADPLKVLPWDREASKETLTCPKCKRENRPWDWTWDHCGGFARQFIEIEPGTPPPSAALIGSLTELHGYEWTWANYHV